MTTCTQNCDRMLEETSLGVPGKLNQILKHWFETQMLKARITHERRQLLAMPDSVLRDIGITRAEAEKEARRLDLPESRLIAQAK